MEFLRFTWKEIRSLRLPLKIALVVSGIALLGSFWYLGIDWWTGRTNVSPWYARIRRMRPRIEYFGVVFGLLLAVYLAGLIDRYRKRR